MRQVAHQTVVIQYILELAKTLKRDPRECFNAFFARMATAQVRSSPPPRPWLCVCVYACVCVRARVCVSGGFRWLDRCLLPNARRNTSRRLTMRSAP